MTTVFRVLNLSIDNKPSALLHCIRGLHSPSSQEPPASEESLRRIIFDSDPYAFTDVPGSPFAYWADDAIRSKFFKNSSLGNRYQATRGAYTTDDGRFYRLCWEVADTKKAVTRHQTSTGRPYVRIAKGGTFSLFYHDVYLVIRWANDGAEAKAFLSAYRARKGWGTDWSACLNGHSHYFRPGLTWPPRTQSGLGVRVMPSGCIFAHKGPAVFVREDSPASLLALLAVMTSRAFRYLVELQMAFGSYEVGVIQRTPVPDIPDLTQDRLAQLTQRAWSLKRQLDTVDETSHAFVLPIKLNQAITGLDREAVQRQLQEVQQEIENLAFDLYHIVPEDRAEIGAWFGRQLPISDSDSKEDDEPADDDQASEDTTAAVLSWLAGVAFGRFDVRLCTRDRAIPPEPEPFDPLPARSPGMWPTGEERPVAPPDILVDDPGHACDLTSHVSAVASTVDVSEPDDLRRWLAREFFPLHIKMYSKSRRKAPIYWQLAPPSARYSVWLYIHAFTRDTMYLVQNDYVVPKLMLEERRLETMRQEIQDRSTAAKRGALTDQEAFVDELRGFLDEVKRVAPLWNPDLDDGVIINFAPLWRLVSHHRPWQKELKTTWDALCAGKYDWAHLAMHLWPERVVPKCVTNRSLAIAHDLEDAFWEQGTDGKWSARRPPTQLVDGLIRERASPAVKSALQNLLSAPTAASDAGARRRRGTTGRGNGGGH